MSSNTARYNDILAKARWYRCSPEVLELQPDLNALDEEKDYCAFCVSTLCEDCPPKPNTVSCKDKKPNFRKRFVELPWSTDNVVDGQQRYAIIGKALEDLATNGAGSVEDVINTIKQYASWVPSFDGLRDYVDHRKSQRILQTITGIAALAVKAKSVITGPLPLLSASQSGSVTLSQEQCACILANGFFCTFPKERGFCNEINFSEIFHTADQLSHGRLDFLLHYFSRVLEKMPTGCVSFCRTALKTDTFPNWANDESQLQSVAVDPSRGFGIFLGCAPVYFPYRMVGGSVLSPTPLNVYQEGIRFLVCPELIVSCLLCEPMTVSWLTEPEAIQIVGAQLFNNCEGYSDGGGWIYSPAPGPSYYHYDDQDRDKFRRVISEVIILNVPFNVHRYQYTDEGIDVELNKAYAGFMSTNNKQPIVVHNNGCSVSSELVEAVRIREEGAFRNEQTIPSYWSNDSDEVGARTYTQDVIGSYVTGFWECGVSRYDKELRSLIQILAAAKAGRDMIYICDFNDVKYGRALVKLYDLLIQKKVTVGALYKALISYEAYHSALMNSPTSNSLPGSANQKNDLSVFKYITSYMTTSSEIQKSQTA